MITSIVIGSVENPVLNRIAPLKLKPEGFKLK